ncbi:MFS transporter [Variovorax sp. JS1663]|uniref:MFS transporter n=1 Tax=Variovorax sp. JS1663 TaxID=1851577 RepID=UPI000B344B6F|nr:MFS transporter [Variovorax sp. JS1663]OUL99461.1 MFS transporter [Variovorax sp. JS1663]
MPFAVYIFALSAFALGLAEFAPIGLSAIVAADMGVDLALAGKSITLFALGATIAAPILSALTSHWTRKNTMLITMAVFWIGSAIAAFAPTITVLLIARFIAGLGHGLFLAVASSTAARLVGPAKAGAAVAVVFGGFTLAMAVGVPISTYLGGIVSWRPIFAAIAVFGAMGMVGLRFGMRSSEEPSSVETSGTVRQAVAALASPLLLSSALITVLGFGGSFTVYTYIAPLLTQAAQVGASTVGAFMLLYGVFAAVGNLIGGSLTDRLGANRAAMTIIGGIALVAFGIWLFAASPVAMGILVALLGLFSFASVPALQARLIGMAAQCSPEAQNVAAGLNVAGFNFGIALGSLLGGAIVATSDIAYTGLAGAAMSALGLVVLGIQVSRGMGSTSRAVRTAGHCV